MSLEDFEQENKTSGSNKSGDAEPTNGLGTDELGAEELGKLEEELDLLMLAKPCIQQLEFNLSAQLDPVSPNRYLIATALKPSSSETQHYLYHLHGLQELIPRLRSLSKSFKSLANRCNTLILAADLEINKLLSNAWDKQSRQKCILLEIEGVWIFRLTERASYTYISPIAMLVMVLTAIRHALMGILRQYCNFILKALCGILLLLSET
ncbi:hypothetical protein FRC09_000591 [Ceratobasidium sp. 395]|nr:hypothetical protein FRC09_000591 [Ceratobasidium sp. 395]